MLDMPKQRRPTRNLSVRGMDADVMDTFNRAAGARGMGQREYIEALIELHQRVRGIEDPRVVRILKDLKLAEVTL